MNDETTAGVYLIRCETTGQSYIGATTNLCRRLYQHTRNIINRNGNEKYLAAFPALDAVEFRILEAMPYPDLMDYGNGDDDCDRCREDERKANDLIALRERYWIDKLKPTLNVRFTKPPFSIKDIPVGPPPELTRVIDPEHTSERRAVAAK